MPDILFSWTTLQAIAVTLAILLATAGGALGRRLSGGLIAKFLPFKVGTQGGRAIGALLAGACFLPLLLLIGQPWWASGIIAVLIMLASGLQGFPRHPASRGGGSIMVPETLGDVVGISALNGVLALLPTMAVVTVVFGATAMWPVVIAALLHGPAYHLATLWQPRWRWADVLNRDGILEAPPLAEFYVGALRSFAIAIAMLA